MSDIDIGQRSFILWHNEVVKSNGRILKNKYINKLVHRIIRVENITVAMFL